MRDGDLFGFINVSFAILIKSLVSMNFQIPEFIGYTNGLLVIFWRIYQNPLDNDNLRPQLDILTRG